MFLGTYTPKLDDKGRLTLPAKYRETLAGGVMVTKGQDHSLAVYPREAFTDLAAFDGSVIPERTKGEISARCDMEPMNFLALNLAHEIITGKRSVDDARKTYAEVGTAFMSGDPSPYLEGLMFEPSSRGTADADEIMPGPMIDEMMQQARSMLSGNGGPS